MTSSTLSPLLLITLLLPAGACAPLGLLGAEEARARPWAPPPPGHGPPGRGERGRGPRVAAIGSFEAVPCTVQPSALPASEVVLSQSVDALWIQANGIPEHSVGAFPNAGNPHTIQPQRHHFSAPTEPSGRGAALPLGKFGIAVNGVPFDPGAAEFWNNDRGSGWQYEAMSGAVGLGLDCNNAHVQPDGTYHYHGMPEGLLDGDEARLVGYAADGYPIYANLGVSSYRLRAGERPPGGPGGQHDGTFVEDYEYVAGLGDLDACNGRVGETPEHGEAYHYVLTDTFPFIPRCFTARPDSSFTRRGGPPR